MFTGIIVATGIVAALEPRGADLRLRVATGKLDARTLQLGDSVAVNGVCLTVAARAGDGFWADISAETLRCTTFGAFRPGERVNLEPALTLNTRLGGHLVSGHVDGIGVVRRRSEEGQSVRFLIEAPASLAKYIAVKGSICVDGVSLTVNNVVGTQFELNIVPHTLSETTLGERRPGSNVNLEVDLVARYLERLLLGGQATQASASSITLDFLAAHGFARGEQNRLP